MAKRRIQEYHVEWIRRTMEECPGIAADTSSAGGVQSHQVFLDGTDELGLLVHEHDFCCTAGQGLEAQGAAASEQIQTASAADQRLEPVEKGLPDPVPRGPYLRQGGKCQSSSSPAATDDPEPTRILSVARRFNS